MGLVWGCRVLCRGGGGGVVGGGVSFTFNSSSGSLGVVQDFKVVSDEPRVLGLA